MDLEIFLKTLFVPIVFPLIFIITPSSLCLGLLFGFLYSFSARKLLRSLNKLENPPHPLNYSRVINYFRSIVINTDDTQLSQLRTNILRYYRVYFFVLLAILVSYGFFLIYAFFLTWSITKSPFEIFSWLMPR